MGDEKVSTVKKSKAQKVKAQKIIVTWDKKVKGLHTRSYPSGRKTYYVYYRDVDGIQKRPKLGDSKEMTLTQAREIASKVIEKAVAIKQIERQKLLGW